ncbi:MAG: DMT family transporter [Candidatus Diapherotrites archaeon]
MNKGLMFALLTAIVSGVAIFVNKFAVGGIDPFAFTTAKNIIVAIFLISTFFLIKDFSKLKALTKKNWLQLGTIGLVGGSIPFLLFFYALSLTSAINAGFIHKSLFLFASVFALIFLKEKLNLNFFVGAVLLLAGNFLLLSISSFGFPEFLILLATLLWAGENVISRHVLSEIPARTVAFGRMFFGSAIMLLFLFATNQWQAMLEFSIPQLQWIILTGALLFLFVLFWYNALKFEKVSIVTSVLLLGQPITALLSLVFLGQIISPNQAAGFLLIFAGVGVIVGFSYTINSTRLKKLFNVFKISY